MSLLIHPVTGTKSAVAGTFSVNIVAKNTILKHIFVKATTPTTTFDVTLTDIYSNVILTRSDNTGELNEMLELPSYGNLTLTVVNSSADEAFTYLTSSRE